MAWEMESIQVTYDQHTACTYELYIGENKTMVKEVTYHVSKKFNMRTYESCKNVQLPSTSDTVMGLLCGPHGSKGCTAERWFDYMGSIAPFQINYYYG